jgi:1,4-alpha-glucan branching enzyme
VDWWLGKIKLGSHGNGWWSAFVEGAGAGQGYKFIFRTQQGHYIWRSDPWAKNSDGSGSNSIIYDSGAYSWNDHGYQTPKLNEMVIYQLHPGTFNWPYNFESLLHDSRLKHLQDLGVNAIQLLPITEYPTPKSWGYNSVSPFIAEEDLGEPDVLKRFVDKAHQWGFAVILDVVYNHFGPNVGDLWRFDGWHENGRGGVYFYQDVRSWTVWGDNTRPDYGREEVRNWLLESARFWAHDFHIDGFRVDSTVNIRRLKKGDLFRELPDGWRLMQDFNRVIKEGQPWKFTIAEDLEHNEWITRSTDRGGAGFNSQWDSRLHGAITEAVVKVNDSERDVSSIALAIADNTGPDPFGRVVFSESHDSVGRSEDRSWLVRLPERISPGNADSWAARKRSLLAAATVLTVQGVPMIFMGQEMLAWGYWGDNYPINWAKTIKFGKVLARFPHHGPGFPTRSSLRRHHYQIPPASCNRHG